MNFIRMLFTDRDGNPSSKRFGGFVILAILVYVFIWGDRTYQIGNTIVTVDPVIYLDKLHTLAILFGSIVGITVMEYFGKKI